MPRVLATIRFYDVMVWLHVSAVIVGIGATFGYAFFQSVAESRAPRSLPAVYQAMSVADRFLLTPCLVIILGAGIYLVVDGPFDWEDTFVTVGLVGIIALFALAGAFFARHERKLIELAERDIAAAGTGEVQLSDEYYAVSRRVALVGTLTGILVLAITFFMIVKP